MQAVYHHRDNYLSIDSLSPQKLICDAKQRVEQPDIAVEGFTYHFLNFRDFQNIITIFYYSIA